MYSAAKAISTTVVHMLVERGDFSLDDRVCDYLPGYTSHGKDRTTIRHVMTHSAGVPFATGPRPDLRRMDDSEYAREMLGNLKPIYPPGLVHMYHGLTWGPLIREIVSAATGRSIREILATEILDPLGFRWTNYGVAEQDVPLVAPSHVTGKPLPAPIAAGVQTRGRRHHAPDHPVLATHRSSSPAWCRRRAPCPTPTNCPGSPKSFAAGANSTACGSCIRKPCGPRLHRAGGCGPTSRPG